LNFCAEPAFAKSKSHKKAAMNIPQRIVLITGAVVLWVIIATAQTHHYVTGWNGQGEPFDGKNLVTRESGDSFDGKKALVRGGFWCVTVAALYFAVGKKK
jgi:hypothetical protein